MSHKQEKCTLEFLWPQEFPDGILQEFDTPLQFTDTLVQDLLVFRESLAFLHSEHFKIEWEPESAAKKHEGHIAFEVAVFFIC